MRVTLEITVRYFTILRNITKRREEEIELNENSTVEDMLNILIKEYGENFERFMSTGKGKRRLQLVFLLNGQDIAQSDGLRTKLHNGDTIAVVPPIAGG